LKAQFISHHDMLEMKEHELVRQDGKVLPCSIWLSLITFLTMFWSLLYIRRSLV